MTTLSATISFYIPFARSLKDKRMVSRSLIDKTKHKFNVAVAEVDKQNARQTLMLGVAVVSESPSHAREMLDEIIRFMEDNTDAVLLAVLEE